jgi:hypothetical protein
MLRGFRKHSQEIHDSGRKGLGNKVRKTPGIGKLMQIGISGIIRSAYFWGGGQAEWSVQHGLGTRDKKNNY